MSRIMDEVREEGIEIGKREAMFKLIKAGKISYEDAKDLWGLTPEEIQALVEKTAKLRRFPCRSTDRHVPAHETRHGLLKKLGGDGFRSEIRGAPLHRQHRRLDVGVTREKEDREGSSAFRELSLQGEAVHAAHAHVEHHAARAFRIVFGEEGFGTFVGSRLPAVELQDVGFGFEHVTVVVDEPDQRSQLWIFHGKVSLLFSNVELRKRDGHAKPRPVRTPGKREFASVPLHNGTA